MGTQVWLLHLLTDYPREYVSPPPCCLLVSLTKGSLQLPHRTGSPSHDFARDEVVVLTRSTLVGVSSACIAVVIEALVQLLEELARPYKAIQSHPVHVVYSELYVLALLADCCAKHWDAVNEDTRPSNSENGSSDSEDSDARKEKRSSPSAKGLHNKRRASRNALLARSQPPEALHDDLVRRLFDAVKLFSKPVPDTYILPSSNILDDSHKRFSNCDIFEQDAIGSLNGQLNGTEVPNVLLEYADAIDAFTRVLVEYLSFANWTRVLGYLKTALAQACNPGVTGPTLPNVLVEDDRSALIVIRFISCFWVDARKLSILMQDLCGSFLHLRKAFQTTVAVVVPQLITRGLERNPDEFVEFHSTRKRLDGGMVTFHYPSSLAASYLQCARIYE
jgi:neurofibromin 1